MSVFDNSSFDDHEQVAFFADPASGLRAIIALHSTALGPAAGGCRSWHYDSSEAALTDALRLSRGMSYKNALAGLSLGGGKAVILRSAPGAALDDSLLESFGRSVDSLGGRYITAEDVGMSVAAMQVVARQTRFVAGLPPAEGAAGGDPSPKTAYGVYCGMLAAARHALGRETLRGMRVAVQGVGNVGFHLCHYLHDAGCELVVADIDAARVERACRDFSARACDLDAILFEDVDIVAPCALGAILDEQSIPRLKARIVAGAANNQLATPADGERLQARDILYCPDYAINAGGIINVACEYEGGHTEREVMLKVEAIGQRLADIFSVAARQDRPTSEIADEMARAIIAAASA